MQKRTNPSKAEEPVHCYLLVMDIRHFSNLPNADHDKVVRNVYDDIARTIDPHRHDLADQKSVGDGFLLYFTDHLAAINVALGLRDLFASTYLQRYKLVRPLECRIALHSGGFFWANDPVERRQALFGRTIITASRLEPVVRPNEIWCTQTFVQDAKTHTLPENIGFAELGNCQFAKEWPSEPVSALYRNGEEVPAHIMPHCWTITHRISGEQYPHSHFALIRLKNKSDGAHHLRRLLQARRDMQIEALYYVFGYHDVIARFSSAVTDAEPWLSQLLISEKITHGNGDCKAYRVDLSGKIDEIVGIQQGQEFFKAFIFVSSDMFAGRPQNQEALIDMARHAGEPNILPKHYTAGSTLILPCVLKTVQYYVLSNIVEAIESFVENRNWEAKSITYPVHDFDEFYNDGGKNE